MSPDSAANIDYRKRLNGLIWKAAALILLMIVAARFLFACDSTIELTNKSGSDIHDLTIHYCDAFHTNGILIKKGESRTIDVCLPCETEFGFDVSYRSDGELRRGNIDRYFGSFHVLRIEAEIEDESIRATDASLSIFTILRAITMFIPPPPCTWDLLTGELHRS